MFIIKKTLLMYRNTCPRCRERSILKLASGRVLRNYFCTNCQLFYHK